MIIKGKAYSCELTEASSVRFESELPIPEDTAVYAVKRFILHSPALRRACTSRSYQLRMGGKTKKRRSLTFEAPARLLELPGSAVRVSLQVTQSGVAVAAVRVKASGGSDSLRICE